MNAFDDLLTAAGRVDDATPEQLRRASGSVHAALSAGPGAVPFTSRRTPACAASSPSPVPPPR
jgi:hypothetical protein